MIEQKNNKYLNFENAIFNVVFDFYDEDAEGIILSLIFLKYINETSGILFNKKIIIPEDSKWENIQKEKDNLGDFLNNSFYQLENKNPILNNTFMYNFNIINSEERKIYEIVKIISSFNLTSAKLLINDIFDSIVRRFINLNSKKRDVYIQPQQITDIMLSFLPVKNDITIYNPFAGIASFALKLPKNASYYGQENSFFVFHLGKLRLLFNGLFDKISYKYENSITNWKHSNKFNYIVGTPSFMSKMNTDELNIYGGNQKFSETFFIDQTIDSISENGKAVICSSQSILFKMQNEFLLRRKLIHRDLLETVIILPPNLLTYTNIPSIILVLNPNKQKKNMTRIIDATECTIKENEKANQVLDVDSILKIVNSMEKNDKSKYISKNTLKSNKYSLDPKRYMRSELLVEEGLQLITLKELVILQKKDNIISGINGKQVNIKDLSDNPLKNEKAFKDIVISKIPKNAIIISENSLLLSTKLNKLKPTYYTGSHLNLYQLKPNIVALKIKTDIIDKDYLIHELYADYVKTQIGWYATGTTIASISLEDLLSIKIKIPKPDKDLDFTNSLKEQRAKVKGIKEAFLIAKAKELGLENHIATIKKDQVEDLRSKKHNISQHLNNVKSSMDSLMKYMSKNEGIIGATDIINPNQGITVLGRFEKMRASLEDVAFLVDNITNDITYGKKEILDLEDLINDCIKRGVSNDNFEIDLQVDNFSYQDEFGSIRARVEFSKLGFIEIYNNILENAIKHSFIEKDRKYKFKIELRHDPQKGGREIVTFLNNGKSFPKGMKERFCIKGEKAGKYGNKGIGTWKICQIVKHFGGKVIPYDRSNSDFPIKIEIILPYKFDSTL